MPVRVQVPSSVQAKNRNESFGFFCLKQHIYYLWDSVTWIVKHKKKTKQIVWPFLFGAGILGVKYLYRL